MSSQLSDFNSSATPSQIVAREYPYADLDMSMTIIPGKNDVAMITDIDAVKNAVKNLVLTNYYEVPFSPFQGGNLRALLFDNATSFTVAAIKNEITRVLIDHEPRINRIAVSVVDRSDSNEYLVTIQFNIRNADRPEEVNFYLQRIR